VFSGTTGSTGPHAGLWVSPPLLEDASRRQARRRLVSDGGRHGDDPSHGPL